MGNHWRSQERESRSQKRVPPLCPTPESVDGDSTITGGDTLRAKKPRYKAVIEFPPLPYDEFLALRNSIAANGLLVPILVDGHGPVRHIIDGNNRKFIANELGYDCPEIVKEGLTEEEQRLFAGALTSPEGT